MNTALLPAEVSPCTVTFHPDWVVVCVTPQFAIVALSVFAWPLSVRAGRLGALGAVENETAAALPGFCLTQSFALRIPAVAAADARVARKPLPARLVAVVA